MELLLVPTMIVGVTELCKRIDDRDWVAVRNILIAVGVGTLAGVWKVEGLTPFTGLLYGLGAAGFVRVGQAVGGK